jgi:hypothetical protein
MISNILKQKTVNTNYISNNKVSFDFDSTLSRTDVQDYVRSLIKRGFEIWVCTSRFEDCKDYTWRKWDKSCHHDLLKVTSELNIPKERIIFTNMQYKWFKMIELGFNPIFHLDDDFVEINGIQRNLKAVAAVSCIGGGWKQKLEKIIKRNSLNNL